MSNAKNRGHAGKKPESNGLFFTGRQTTAVLVLMLVFFTAFFVDTWSGVQCIRCGYEIVDAGFRHEKLVDLQKKLTIEQSRLISPALLAQKAKKDFGLVTPEPSQIIVVP